MCPDNSGGKMSCYTTPTEQPRAPPRYIPRPACRGAVSTVPALTSPRRAWERQLPWLVIAATLGGMGGGLLATYLWVGVDQGVFATILGIATLCGLLVPYAVRRSGTRWELVLRQIFLVSSVVAIVSVLTGIANGGTDENRTTAAFLKELGLGHDPYSTLLTLHYRVSVLGLWQYPVTSTSYDPYLPLLMFVQVPGTGYLGYDGLCLACWGGLVYVVRKDEFAALALASPMVALVAANGFNDLPVLFLTTLALRGSTGSGSKLVEFLTYGLKQFANLFWIGFYAVHRRWWNVLGVAAGTLAIAAPFLIWHPSGFWCHAVTFNVGPGCSGPGPEATSVTDYYPHWNYYLWLAWLVALFPVPIAAWLVRRKAWFSRLLDRK